jgi:hypothetical protein
VQTFDFSQMRTVVEELTSGIAKELASMRSEFRTEADALAVKLQKLENYQESTPDHNHRTRGRSDGGAANYAGIF